jgi:microsomal dipeptidase-like Zn-dependent dipeptidase
MSAPPPVLIDGLQFCRWSREIFVEMREGGLTAVHATVAYHEGFRETVRHLADWNARFRDHADLILFARTSEDIARAVATSRTAIFLGLQNPMPLEDDLDLVEILHELGVRFLQLTYNNQSLLGSGWMEPEDGGVTRMGREVIREMNRLGMVIDLSHAGERTTLEAIEHSRRPVAITHANPRWLRNTGRNVSKVVLKALGERDGMLGLSLYPLHLTHDSETTLAEFAEMAAEAAEVVGIDHLGIGSDLCQGQPDSVVRWMREGRWTRPDPAPIVFPAQPGFFRGNRDFAGLADGLRTAGFGADEAGKVMGGNWRDFLGRALTTEG